MLLISAEDAREIMSSSAKTRRKNLNKKILAAVKEAAELGGLNAALRLTDLEINKDFDASFFIGLGYGIQVDARLLTIDWNEKP